jgi:TonB family protein
VGVTLALNAETVTDFVYKNDEPQKQVPVKKGKRNTTIKTGSNQGINVIEIVEPKSDDELKVYDTTLGESEPNMAVLILNTKKKGEEPLLIVDKKIATIEQVRALPRDAVASVGTMREEAAISSYGEKAKYGALIITTVKHQKEIYNEQISQPDVFDKVDEAPQFPGGMAGMMQYLSSNIRYPEDAREAGTQGRVIVSFIVEKDGSISNAKVAKPTYSSLDEEALRVVSAMPNWMPGKQNGQAVRVKYAVPVSFRLKGEDLLSGMSESTSFKDLTNRLPGAEIDENGKIFINGKEVKRLVFDGSENDIGIAIMNIMLKDPDRFDYEVDGEPVTVKDMKEKNASKTNPIKKIEYVAKDSEHPKDRLLITTK